MRLLVCLLLLSDLTSVFAALHPDHEMDLVQQATNQGLAFDIQWLKLLHYQKNWSGDFKSEADGDTFFLSKHGKESPESELTANIQAFFLAPAAAATLDVNESPRCKFPARYRWLKARLRFDDSHLAHSACTKFIQFSESVAAKSASIVFSSYYLNNPASAFGHTLLRLNKTKSSPTVPGKDEKHYELLDNGINYAAVVTEENPILYAIYGLFGLFKGTFTRIPYYYKVREYNDFESRDLWVYDLKMGAEQITMLVSHIWELGSTYFDYFYLTENCSYHILTALEAAIPHLELSAQLPLVVVPADTIKVISAISGLVERVHYRPSVRSQFLARLKTMPEEQIGIVKKLADSHDLSVIPATLSDADRATVFDGAIDQVDFKSFRKLVFDPEGDEAQWKQRLLVSRARIPVRSNDLVVSTPVDDIPHTGHEIMRAGIDGGGSSTLGAFGAAHFRFALHDLLDPKTGYPEHSQIEFFQTRMRFLPAPREVWLEDLALFKVVSLSPLTQFDQQLSWKVKVGGTTVRDSACDHCFAGQVELGGGVAKTLFGHTTAFLSLDVEGMIASGFAPRSWLRPGVGPSLLVRARLTPTLITLFQASYSYRFFTDSPQLVFGSAEVRWALSREIALNLKTSLYQDSWETQGGVYFYF